MLRCEWYQDSRKLGPLRLVDCDGVGEGHFVQLAEVMDDLTPVELHRDRRWFSIEKRRRAMKIFFTPARAERGCSTRPMEKISFCQPVLKPAAEAVCQAGLFGTALGCVIEVEEPAVMLD